MSEYTERFSLSRLIGAPPGYVGYEEGGELTEKIRRNPYSVVLFDEIEKGHYDIFNILLQLFDEGVLTDGLGRKVNFRNTIIIMTSNIGSKNLYRNKYGFGSQLDNEQYIRMKEKILSSVKKIFSPELVNRIDESIVFNQLSKSDVYDIIDLQVYSLRQNLLKLGFRLRLNKSAKKLIAKKGYNPKYGVRPLQREIQKQFEDPISEIILKNKFPQGTTISIKASKNKFVFNCIYGGKSKVKTS